FGNINSGVDGDSGTSRRVFGTLITWMQEKTSPVFMVATANNVQILPAELLRGCLKSFRRINSLLHKQSPPAWTNEKLRI
ncbi:MAG: AAA family ATPase, partial [Dolichospermum sp.]